MSRTIHRFEIPIDDKPVTFEAPFIGDKVTALPSREAFDRVDIWLEVNQNHKVEPRKRAFLVVGTGHSFPPGFWWVATVPGAMGLIWHVLEGVAP